jgi:hypothetical protein
VNVLYGQNEAFLSYHFSETKNVNIVLYNVLGEKIYELKNLSFMDKIVRIPSNLPKGICLAESEINGEKLTRKILVPGF